uniref:V-type proton ATPase subunit E n=1 Tax=Ananas comosus var. bracteatus TaxID=296719 RepID=A0A6V7NU03_ANACO|nr:unnamed protein product [Ananas comosus var. bracteatus]
MDDAAVAKQIEKLVRFILREAEEKANDIMISAEEEFDITKSQLVESEKRKIKGEYDRKFKQVEVRRRIEYSRQVNASRVKVLQVQHDLVNSMRTACSDKLLRIADDSNAYKELLRGLIVQSLVLMREPSVLLWCREIDRYLVESILDEAAQEYARRAKVHPPKVTVDEKVYLPSPPTHHECQEHSGGIVIASQDRKILCENTLDARLDLAFKQKLPQIRRLLYGEAVMT